MKNSLSTFFISAKFGDIEFKDYLTDFSYTHAEEEDDSCSMSFHLHKPELLDSGAFKKDVKWVVKWGWLEDLKNCHSEKIFIEEVTPDFSEEGVKVSITAHDKIAKVKKIRQGGVAKNASLPAYLANKMAPHGITTRVEIPDENIKKFFPSLYPNAPQGYVVPKGETPTPQQWKKIMRYQEYISDKNKSVGVEVSPGTFRDYDEAGRLKILGALPATRKAIEDGLDPNRVEYAYWAKAKFYKPASTAEGNRTTQQVAKSIAERDPNGPYVITGHGDTLTIKNRALNKKPIYSYKYKSEPGELISFRPSSKNKSSQSTATATGVAGWDPLQKRAFMGNSIDGYNPQVGTALGGGAVNTSNEVRGYFTRGQSNGATSGFSKNYLNQTLAVRDNIAAPIKSLTTMPIKQEEIPSSTPTPNRQILSSQHDPEAAMAQANNSQASGAIEQNPGSLVVVGNPLLISGETVQITNVGKSYSGNYYILKATHKCGVGSAYTTDCEIVRNTVAIIPNMPATESIPSSSNQKINNQDSSGDTTTKIPAIKID